MMLRGVHRLSRLFCDLRVQLRGSGFGRSNPAPCSPGWKARGGHASASAGCSAAGGPCGSGKGAAAGKSGTMACRDGAGADLRRREPNRHRRNPWSVLTRVLVLRGNGPASQDGECYRNDHHQPEWNSRHAHSPAAICKSAHDVRSTGAVAAHATHKFLSEAGSHLKARRHDGHYLIRHCDSPYGVRVTGRFH